MPLCTIQMQFLLFDREISYILKRIMELEANKDILLVIRPFGEAKDSKKHEKISKLFFHASLVYLSATSRIQYSKVFIFFGIAKSQIGA